MDGYETIWTLLKKLLLSKTKNSIFSYSKKTSTPSGHWLYHRRNSKGGVAIAKGAGKVAKAGAKTGAKVAKAGLKTGKKIATYTVKKGVKGAKSVYDSIRKKTKGKKKEKKYFQSPTLKF